MRRNALLVVTVLAVLLAGCTPTNADPVPTVSASRAPVDYTVWSAGRSTPVADPIYPAYGNAGIDVLHYGLELSWAPETKLFAGQATLRLRAAVALTEVALDLSAAYQIDGVTLDGTKVTGSFSGEKFKVAKPLAKDSFATLVVRYHGTPKTVKMPSHRSDAENLGLSMEDDGSLWTMQEPYGAFTWYPVNDIAITAPAGWAGIASGTPDGQEGNTYRYTSKDPVASYLTTLAVGKYQKETATGPHGLPLTYWFRPGIDDGMMKLVRKSPQYVTWLEERFGPYPFPSGGIVLVDSESGMETQQMITMGSGPVAGNKQLSDGMDADLLHEYAHQWFGNTLSPTSWQDLWLNEGWAMYAQLLYEQQRDHLTATQLDDYLVSADTRVRTQSGPPGHPRADSFAEGNVYLCPALMLHNIHKKIGDTAFLTLGRDWAQQNRNTSQDRATFIAFVNKHTGTDFTQLINTWLDSPTTPAASRP